MIAVLSSIPSPSTGTLVVGPLRIRAYGLKIALGVVAATWLAGRRLERAGSGTNDDMQSIAVWAVAPAIPLGPSIDRWGNWRNQELYGRTTSLPWALEISDENLSAGGVIEGLRVDPAHEFGEFRLNQWVAGVVVIASVVSLIVDRVRLGPIPDEAPPSPRPRSSRDDE